MSLRVLIADDHQLFRLGLRHLLETEPGIEVVGEASDGRATVLLADELHPDVVVMDVGMPGMSGIEATRQIVALGVPSRVLALSMHAGAPVVLGMLQAGAAGYLLKDSAPEELREAIETVAAGGSYLSPSVAGHVIDAWRAGPDDASKSQTKLTPREREVLQLIIEGSSNKAIAERLHISVKTVETHRQNIGTKLGVKGTAELVRFALDHELIPATSEAFRREGR